MKKLGFTLLIFACTPSVPPNSSEPEETPVAEVQSGQQPDIQQTEQTQKTQKLPKDEVVSQITADVEETEESDDLFPVKANGTVTFALIENSLGYWDYEGESAAPARRIRVILSHEEGQVVATTHTDANGDYAFDTEGPEGRYLVAAISETRNSTIRVEDNTQSDALYGVNSALFEPSTSAVTLDLHAGSGWSGDNATGSYDGPRTSAPFAIIHFLQMAEATYAEGSNLPGVKVNWSINNRSVVGDKAIGEITTSHWDGLELYIRGEADVNADEYDPHVLIHEWMHYFHDAVGRSDSPGGSHALGENLDARLTFSEGLANAASSLVDDVGTTLIDVYGSRQGSATLGLDLEDRTSMAASGWYSELAISYLIHDLFDEPIDTDDNIAIDTVDLSTTLMAQSQTAIPATIFSFLHELKNEHGGYATQIDTMTTTIGVAAITDARGSTETDDGGFAGSLPPIHQLAIGGGNTALSLLDDPGESDNRHESTRHVVFTATSNSTRIRISSVPGDMRVWMRDKMGILESWDFSTDQTIDIATENGETYSLALTIKNESNSTESINVAVEDTP